MDKKRNDEQILQALQALGIDSRAERLRAEAFYLLTLFEQGKTIEEALDTVDDLDLRNRLKPFVYYSTLRALALVASRLDAITPEQFTDLEGYLLERVNSQAIHLQQ